MNHAIQFFGSVWFLLGNFVVFGVWLFINISHFDFIAPFDPYPFEFLTLWISLEAIVLSIIVLIAQNKLQIDSVERAQLDLHINLLAESETTLILKKLERLEKHFKIHTDETEQNRVKDLIEETRPEHLAQFIHETSTKIAETKPEDSGNDS